MTTMLGRRGFLAAALGVRGASPAAGATDIPPIRGLSRTNLLEYRSCGRLHNAMRPRDWETKRKREAMAAMTDVTGRLPGSEKRCRLDVKIEDEADLGSYVRRAIVYSSEPGSRTTAFLCIPKKALTGQEKAHGVLCLHPTDNTAGYKVVVGLGGRPHRQYAAELAERGYVTISPSYPQLAAYQPDLAKLGYASGTMKAIWDNVRAIDLLEKLPYVRKGVAAIGHSLGGHNAIYTAVFDPRVRVIVSSCGFDSFLDYYGGKIKGWTQDRYMARMAAYVGRPQDVPFDFYELIAALAPRPVFVNAPLRDSNFRHDSVDRIAEAARAVYRLYGAEGRLRVEHPDSEHDFPDAVRMAAYEWIAAGITSKPTAGTRGLAG